jgi:hypothetical protein
VNEIHAIVSFDYRLNIIYVAAYIPLPQDRRHSPHGDDNSGTYTLLGPHNIIVLHVTTYGTERIHVAETVASFISSARILSGICILCLLFLPAIKRQLKT